MKAGDAGEKLRIPLLATPCFECYVLIILNSVVSFLHAPHSYFRAFSLVFIPDGNALPPLFGYFLKSGLVMYNLHTVKFTFSRCMV